MMRLFVAIAFAEEIAAHLKRAQEILRPAMEGVSWSAAGEIHLTLKFLGEVGGPEMAALKEMLGTLPRSGAIELRALGVETFPPGKPTRVIVASVGGEVEKLRALQENIERGCGMMGYPREQRPFRPHATLGRPKAVRRDLRVPATALTGGMWPGPAFVAREFVLMESRARGTGREYLAVGKYALE